MPLLWQVIHFAMLVEDIKPNAPVSSIYTGLWAPKRNESVVLAGYLILAAPELIHALYSLLILVLHRGEKETVWAKIFPTIIHCCGLLLAVTAAQHLVPLLSLLLYMLFVLLVRFYVL